MFYLQGRTNMNTLSQAIKYKIFIFFKSKSLYNEVLILSNGSTIEKYILWLCRVCCAIFFHWWTVFPLSSFT